MTNQAEIIKKLPLKTAYYQNEQNKKPDAIVIMLHGYGSNGDDLILLAPYLVEGLGNTLFLSPDAPHRCGVNPMGYEWFPLPEITPNIMRAGVKFAEAHLFQYLDCVIENYAIDPAQIMLLGFSQGTMMALHCGLRTPYETSGILGYSGHLAMSEDLPKDVSPPIQLVHGMMDNVVPHQLGAESKTILQNLGYQVDLTSIPMLDHSIDQDGVSAGLSFMQKSLK